MYLPAASEGVDAIRTETPRGDRTSGTETILLVEDEPPVRELVGEILERSGYTVLQAASAESAVKACQAYPDTIHLLLTDVVMPGVGGAALAVRLRQERAGLRVLFMSGYTDDAVGRHGFLDQGAAFIQKPFTAQALAEKVREALEQPAPASPPQAGQ